MLTWVEISRPNLLHNLEQFRRILPPEFRLMAVIKSNAYGHGMTEVAQVIESGVQFLVVASVKEALELRAAGINKQILVLGNYDPRDRAELLAASQADISLTVSSLEQAEQLSAVARQHRQLFRVHLKVDTGMTRFGVSSDKVGQSVDLIRSMPLLDLQGIYSHLATADEKSPLLEAQFKRFREILQQVNQHQPPIPYVHIANSAGCFWPEVPGNTARLGIGLYGLYPSDWSRELIRKQHPDFKLWPVLSWKTTIVQARSVPAKTSVSYGATFTTERPSKLAVIPVGYWDGFDRGLSNIGAVLVQGERCPIRGRVCMNQTIIDVTEVPEVTIGDEVVLLGESGDQRITAEELAEEQGTINYEVVTRINSAIPRVVI